MLNNIFFLQPAKVLVAILNGANTIKELQLKLNISYAHLFYTLISLSEYGLVELKDRDGRSYEIVLTEEGKEIAILIKNIMSKIRRNTNASLERKQ